MTLERIARTLCEATDALDLGLDGLHVYNPLRYAWAPHAEYLARHGRARGGVLLVGMNPGPFGMVQTGVPFGDPVLTREFLGIRSDVARPEREHPRRPVLGFASPRREVSGQRLWGLAAERFGTAERFFEGFFVLNYCPLAFLEASGRNLTPEKLPAPARSALFARCDAALVETIDLLAPTAVVGIGAFAEERVTQAVRARAAHVRTGSILHPSPASPRANRGWAAEAERDLARLGIVLPAVPPA